MIWRYPHFRKPLWITPWRLRAKFLESPVKTSPGSGGRDWGTHATVQWGAVLAAWEVAKEIFSKKIEQDNPQSMDFKWVLESPWNFSCYTPLIRFTHHFMAGIWTQLIQQDSLKWESQWVPDISLWLTTRVSTFGQVFKACLVLT